MQNKEGKKSIRNLYQIYRDILYIAGRGEIKTHIMQKANTNATNLDEHAKALQNAGLLHKQGRLYQTTEKGFQYIKTVGFLEKMLQPEHES